MVGWEIGTWEEGTQGDQVDVFGVWRHEIEEELLCGRGSQFSFNDIVGLWEKGVFVSTANKGVGIPFYHSRESSSAPSWLAG